MLFPRYCHICKISALLVTSFCVGNYCLVVLTAILLAILGRVSTQMIEWPRLEGVLKII